MYFLFHSLWSITSAKLSRISIQLNKHVIVLQKGRNVMSIQSVCLHVCVCVCVWLVPVATVWLYQGGRLFESLCGLFLMLTSQCLVCLVVCVVWTRGYMGSVLIYPSTCAHGGCCETERTYLHTCVCVCFTLPCSSVGLRGSCVSIPVDVKQLNSTSLLGS